MIGRKSKGEGGEGEAFDEPEVPGVGAAVFGFVGGLSRDVEGAVEIGEVLQHGAQVVQCGGEGRGGVTAPTRVEARPTRLGSRGGSKGWSTGRAGRRSARSCCMRARPADPTGLSGHEVKRAAA